ncbi:MAG: flagellar basal body P-ring protein FlgI [Pseudomonadota bacterium]|jgi:flagellar P-ring protein precursor FlgI|nr:flagellar basal body P-ring protein FlgI [Pseudomonadota bacterium]MEE3008232.1 flagellar basal body P-ring protein FlgI [Pseudomonadota bacterium]|tara:strand:- start:1243 stop:2391 length:1149 start_codon:yes stop_codon:yes gene_type:complete
MTDFLNFSLAAIRKISGFLPVFFVLTIFDIRTLDAQTRIKDIVDFEGVRENMLIGYGLVVGLNGTGDTLSSSIFTRESLVGMLERLGVNARDDSLKTDNVAAVMVTATLPPFAKQGTRIDLSLSAIGDADSLLGGTLLVTPLVGADGEVYAVAQGPVAVGGVSAGGAGAEVSKGVPTNGRIASGAIIEREISFDLQGLDTLRISLRNPDFTTARRIAQAINSFVGGPIAQSRDSATVSLVVPDNYRGKMVALITDIEQLRVTPDISAKVVIDEQTGIIVMGENVRISTVAIAQGNLTIRITETPQVSQPLPFSEEGETVTVPRTQIEIDEDEDKRLSVLSNSVTLQELVDGLNALGIGPRDMISILQAIKAAGALQAEIELL